MKACKHENKKRLYTRGKIFESIPYYKCSDCDKFLKIETELKSVEVKMKKQCTKCKKTIEIVIGFENDKFVCPDCDIVMTEVKE